MNSKFIVIEGLEGSGKTSISTQVADILRSYGVSDLVFTREPGGTPLAEALRTLIKKGVDNEPVNHCAELLMLYAARAQLIESVIKPAFTRGAWVIADRYDLSSQAYQGGGRGIDRNLLTILRNVVLGDFYPDLTLYLDVPPTVGLAHAKARGKLDRIEMESLEFFDRVRTSYRTLAEEDDRIITIDASQPQSMVNAEIHNQLTKWLCEQLTSS